MMIRFEIEAKKLAADSKVSEIQISRFRRGKQDLHAEALLRLLANVPQGAKQWYLNAVLAADVQLGTEMGAFPHGLNPQELSQLLYMAAEWLKNSNSTEALQSIAKI